MIRALVVGCGNMAQDWVPMLLNRGIELVGCVDTDARAARSFGRQHQANWFVDLDEALVAGSGKRANLIVNLTPPEWHYTVILTAIRHRIDVVTEKPFTPDIAEAEALVLSAAQAGTRIFVMQNRRYEPGYQILLDEVQAWSGPLYVSCDFFVPWTFGGFRDEMASPLLEDMLIHSLDQARFLVPGKASWVHGVESDVGGSWMKGEACVTATVGFDDGSVYSYRGSWCSAGARTSWNGVWSVHGPGRSILWDGEDRVELVLSQLDDQGRPDSEPRTVMLAGFPDGSGHERCLDQILRHLAGGEESVDSGSSNLMSVRLLSALRESCRTSAVVPLLAPSISGSVQ